MVKTKHLFVSAIVFGLISGAALAQSKDPLVGTWKLNAAKSTGLPLQEWHQQDRAGRRRRQVYR